jgi:hypothetical protein
MSDNPNLNFTVLIKSAGFNGQRAIDADGHNQLAREWAVGDSKLPDNRVHAIDARHDITGQEVIQSADAVQGRRINIDEIDGHYPGVTRYARRGQWRLRRSRTSSDVQLPRAAF